MQHHDSARRERVLRQAQGDTHSCRAFAPHAGVTIEFGEAATALVLAVAHDSGAQSILWNESCCEKGDLVHQECPVSALVRKEATGRIGHSGLHFSEIETKILSKENAFCSVHPEGSPVFY